MFTERTKRMTSAAALIALSTALVVVPATAAQAVTNPNLALGKTVQSSSSVETGGYGATKLVDGIRNYPNFSTSIGYSSSGSPTVNHTEWVSVNLGASSTIGEVDLFPINSQGDGFPIDFTIQTSPDGSTWTTRQSYTAAPNPGRAPKLISLENGSVTAQYVRVNATKLQNVAGIYSLKLSELEVLSYARPNFADIAYGKTVTTSSSLENYNWAAANLTDGIRSPITASPGWTSSNSTGSNHTEWAQIDLGYQFPLFEVILDSASNNDGFPIDFTIQISADNSTWTTVATRTGLAAPGSVSQDFRFPTTTARYVKVVGTNLMNVPSYGYAMRLGEMSVFTDQGDLAVGKTVTASSTIEGSGGWGVTNVVDGVTVSDATTAGWSSNSSTGSNHTEWVQLDLGQTYGVGEVDLYPVYSSGQGFPIDFTIQTSTDGTTWSTPVTRTGFANPGGTKQAFTFTNAGARYVKVQGTNLWHASGSYYMQFAEIGVSRTTTYTNTSTADYTMEDVTTSSSAVIAKTDAGSSGNSNGYETGHVIKLADGTYRMVATEMYDPTNAWVPARIGLWSSSDGSSWTRLSTLVTGNGITGDAHNYTWAPHFYYNTSEGRWDIIYRGNATLFELYSTVSGTGGINGPYSESATTVSPILGNRKYWQNPGLFDGISNPYTVGTKLYAFIGDGASIWGPGLVTADSITGPWTEEPTSDIQTFTYAENPITAQLSDGTYVAVFDDINTGARTLGFGYSMDGIHWVQKTTNIQVPWAATNGPVNSVRTPLSIIPQSDGTFTVYFTAQNSSNNYWEVGKVNVQINKFVKGNSVATSSTYSTAWTATNLTDATHSTAWSSVVQASSTGAEWMSFDKGQVGTVSGLSVYPRTSGGVAQCFPVDFKIQYSTDGQNWTDVPGQAYTGYATPGNNAVNFTFGSSVQARYVRLYATRFSTDGVGSYYLQAADLSIF